MARAQLSELLNARVHLEEARGLSRNLAYHRRARLEARIDEALDEVDRQIGELRAYRGYRKHQVRTGTSLVTFRTIKGAGGQPHIGRHDRAKSVPHGPTADVPSSLDPRRQGQHRPRPRLVYRGARRVTCLVPSAVSPPPYGPTHETPSAAARRRPAPRLVG